MDVAARVRQRGALSQGFRSSRHPSRRLPFARRSGADFHLPSSLICATTTPSACSRCRASRSSRIHASSGTTGKPTVVGYTKSDIETWATVMARSIRAAGARPGDMVHVAYGYGLFTGGLGAHYGAEKLGCTVIPMSGGQTEKTGPADPGLQAARDHGDAVVHAGDRRGNGEAGHRPASDVAGDRHLRRRAVDADDARKRSRRDSTSTRSTSSACPKSWVPASRRNASRPRTG